MHDRQNDRHHFQCDGCGEVFIGRARADFVNAWEEAKEEGWKTRNIYGVWSHYCEGCKVEET